MTSLLHEAAVLLLKQAEDSHKKLAPVRIKLARSILNIKALESELDKANPYRLAKEARLGANKDGRLKVAGLARQLELEKMAVAQCVAKLKKSAGVMSKALPYLGVLGGGALMGGTMGYGKGRKTGYREGSIAGGGDARLNFIKGLLEMEASGRKSEIDLGDVVSSKGVTKSPVTPKAAPMPASPGMPAKTAQLRLINSFNEKCASAGIQPAMVKQAISPAAAAKSLYDFSPGGMLANYAGKKLGKGIQAGSKAMSDIGHGLTSAKNQFMGGPTSTHTTSTPGKKRNVTIQGPTQYQNMPRPNSGRQRRGGLVGIPASANPAFHRQSGGHRRANTAKAMPMNANKLHTGRMQPNSSL